MKMKMFEKGQGATEYLLMLAAVLVIVAIAVYYVTTAGAGYPAI
ncbi:MAG: class III signal peptide-containing protein, partial [Hadesarchaea archaeon]